MSTFAIWALTSLGLIIASLILTTLVLLLLPGRKGFLTVEQRVMHPGLGVEQAWELYRQRLEYEGFDIQLVDVPNTLRAKRRGKTLGLGAPLAAAARGKDVPDEVVTHASKPLSIVATFGPSGNGVEGNFRLRMDDFVLWDTGERRQLQLMLHRLLAAELQ